MVDNIFPSKLPAIIINSDPDRNQSFIRQLAPSMKVIQLDKVKGTDIDIDDPKIVGSNAYNTIIKGAKSLYDYASLDEVGDTLTHLKAWYAILDSGAPAAWVFSNDINIPSGFFDKVDVAYKMYPLMDAYSQWDLWLFNYSGLIDTMPAPVFGKDMLLVEEFRGMYAYMITRGAILRMLPHVLPTESKVDFFVNMSILRSGINVIFVNGITVEPATGMLLERFALPRNSRKKKPYTRKRMTALGIIFVILATIYFIKEKKN